MCISLDVMIVDVEIVPNSVTTICRMMTISTMFAKIHYYLMKDVRHQLMIVDNGRTLLEMLVFGDMVLHQLQMVEVWLLVANIELMVGLVVVYLLAAMLVDVIEHWSTCFRSRLPTRMHREMVTMR